MIGKHLLCLCCWTVCLHTWGQAPNLFWYAPTARVEQPDTALMYAKLELGFSWPGTDTMSAVARYRFDEVRGLLTGPDGQQREVLVYYHQPLRYGNIQKKRVYGSYRVKTPPDQIWLPASDSIPQHPWRMRFVLNQPGRWQLQLLRGGARSPWGDPILLYAHPSEQRGPLHFPPGERYLRDGQGRSVMLLGHSLAYLNNKGQPAPYADVRPDGDAEYARNTVWEYERFFDDMVEADEKGAGANYCRILLAPWTLDLEVHQLGDYDACQNRAFDLDQMVEMAAARGIYLHLGLYDHVYFNHHPDLNRRLPYYHWDNNPYHTQIPGINEPVAFFTDRTAITYAKQKIRYLIARYGYSPAFFALELFSETDNFLAANHRYYRRHAEAIDGWNVELGNYVQELSQHVLVTTGVMNPNSGDGFWGEASCDFSSFHVYQSMKNTGYFTHYLTQRYWQTFQKPTQIGEYGFSLRNEAGQDCAWDTHSPDPTTYSIMHNSLWFSSLSGSFSTAMIWYYWIYHAHWLSPKGAAFYGPLARFWADEDLGDLRPLHNPCGTTFLPDFEERVGVPNGCYPDRSPNPDWTSRGIYTSQDASLQVFALANEEKVLGWVHNKHHYWYDLPHTASANNRDGIGCEAYNWPAGASETNAGLDPRRYPFTRETLTIPVSGPGRYRLEWWSTYPSYDYSGDGAIQGGGGRIDPLTETLEISSSSATIVIPPLVAIGQATDWQAPDYAFKLIRL